MKPWHGGAKINMEQSRIELSEWFQNNKWIKYLHDYKNDTYMFIFYLYAHCMQGSHGNAIIRGKQCAIWLHKQISKDLMEKCLEITEETQHEEIQSNDNQEMLWSACDFDQADKSCLKVRPGVYMPSGCVGCNVTPPELHKYVHICVRKLNFWPQLKFQTPTVYVW